MVKAYSYVRFSTPEQLKGDSLTRQTKTTRDYAARKGLELGEETFQDLGVSAFRGKNAEEGALKAFRRALEDGSIEPGSYLLIENTDRLTRLPAWQAAQLLGSIVEAGAVVVDLSDEKEYSAATLTEDPYAFLTFILKSIRGHDESRRKAETLRGVWDRKRESVAQGKPVTAICPAWLYLDRKGGKFATHKDRAEVVRRIFRDTLNNMGRNAIAEALNREGVEPWGTGKKKGQHWHSSYIAKILDNPAVLGTLIPHVLAWDQHGNKYRKPLEAVEGYYPAVVDPETFRRVQDLRKAKSPRRGRHAAGEVRNLFGGLMVCGRCGATVTRVSKGTGPKGGEYLACTRAKAGAGCKYQALRYGHTERTFLDAAEWLIAEAPAGDRDGEIDEALQQADGDLLALSDALENLFATLEVAGPSHALTERLRKLEGEREALAKKRRDLEAERERAQGPFVERKLDLLRAALTSSPLDRTEANAALRQAMRRVVVNYSRGTLACEWWHGGETEVQVWWPQDGENPV